MSELQLEIRTEAALREQWTRNIQHGVLMGAMSPVPKDGATVTVNVVPQWGGDGFAVSGTVLHASMAASVVQLDELTTEVLESIAALGIEEAAKRAAEPRPEPKAAPEPEATPEPEAAAPEPEAVAPEPEAAAPEPEAAAPVAPAPAAPAPAAPAPPVATPPVFAPPPQGGFAPPSQGGFAPPSQGGYAPQQQATAQQNVAGGAVDLSDARQIAAASGPGTAGALALLPEATVHGDFGTSSWRDTLLHLQTEQVTGILVIRALREMRWCYLVEGAPVHFLGDQPHPGEFLSDVLIADGHVTREIWNEALRSQGLTGMMPGEILLGSGAIKPDVFRAAMRARAVRITQNLMGMNFGKFTFHPYEELKKIFPFDRVDLLSLLLGHNRKVISRLLDEDLYKQTEDLFKQHVRITPGREGMVAQLELNEIETHLATVVVPAGWQLAEMITLREMEERALLRLVLVLKGMGMLEFVREEGERSKRNRAERFLYETLGDVNRRNAFEAIRSHWSSSVEEVEQGYQRMKHDCRRERFQPYMDARIEELLAQVHAKLDETWAKLKAGPSRKAIRNEFVEKGQLRMASDLLYAQAEMARYKNEYGLARLCYVRVLELDPGGPDGAENVAGSKRALEDPELSAAALADSGVDIKALQRRLDAEIS